jgi:hypothetical protein
MKNADKKHVFAHKAEDDCFCINCGKKCTHTINEGICPGKTEVKTKLKQEPILAEIERRLKNTQDLGIKIELMLLAEWVKGQTGRK